MDPHKLLQTQSSTSCPAVPRPSLCIINTVHDSKSGEDLRLASHEWLFEGCLLVSVSRCFVRITQCQWWLSCHLVSAAPTPHHSSLIARKSRKARVTGDHWYAGHTAARGPVYAMK